MKNDLSKPFLACSYNTAPFACGGWSKSSAATWEASLGGSNDRSGMLQEAENAEAGVEHRRLSRGLGLFDSTMIVAGSMIGSGIFLVAAEMAREVGSSGWLLLAWVIGGFLTLAAALSYGELAAMMPQ